jgi:hypothetical protein
MRRLTSGLIQLDPPERVNDFETPAILNTFRRYLRLIYTFRCLKDIDANRFVAANANLPGCRISASTSRESTSLGPGRLKR